MLQALAFFENPFKWATWAVPLEGAARVPHESGYTCRNRPKDDTRPTLLPIGETTELPVYKNMLLLRLPPID